MVTPDGLPLAYEVMSGNTSDKTTLREFLARIERQYGKAQRTWLMDLGTPTEALLAEMRSSDPPVQYLVGTPKGRLTRLERDLARQALAAGPTRRGGEAPAPGWRALRSSPRASTASPRSAPCASASSNGYGSVSENSRR